MEFGQKCLDNGASQGRESFTSTNLQLLIYMLVNMFMNYCRFVDVNNSLPYDAPF